MATALTEEGRHTAAEADRHGAGTTGPSRSAPWRPALAWSLGGYLVLHVVAETVALVTAYGLHFPQLVRRTPSALLDVWFHWDAGWYTLIADRGFAHSSNHGFRAEAFGPVLPYAIRAVSHVLHISSLHAGLLITNVCLLGALVLLFRLVDAAFGRRVAASTVVVLLLWPTSFFFVAPYTESLVLLFGVAAFSAARSRHWLLAGLLAAAGVMTKSLMGCILVGLLWECVVERRRLPRLVLARDAALLTVPTALALAGWAVYMNHLFGDPLAFVHAQKTWGRTVAWPWVLIRRTAGDLVHLRFLDDTPQARLMELLDAVTVALMIAASIFLWRLRQRGYAVWAATVSLVFLCSGSLQSQTREVLWLFPVFVAGAVVVTRRPWLERLYSPVAAATAVFVLARFIDNRFSG